MFLVFFLHAFFRDESATHMAAFRDKTKFKWKNLEGLAFCNSFTFIFFIIFFAKVVKITWFTESQGYTTAAGHKLFLASGIFMYRVSEPPFWAWIPSYPCFIQVHLI